MALLLFGCPVALRARSWSVRSRGNGLSMADVSGRDTSGPSQDTKQEKAELGILEERPHSSLHMQAGSHHRATQSHTGSSPV